MPKTQDKNPFLSLLDKEHHEWKKRKRELWQREFEELEDFGLEELEESDGKDEL